MHQPKDPRFYAQHNPNAHVRQPPSWVAPQHGNPPAPPVYGQPVGAHQRKGTIPPFVLGVLLVIAIGQGVRMASGVVGISFQSLRAVVVELTKP